MAPVGDLADPPGDRCPGDPGLARSLRGRGAGGGGCGGHLLDLGDLHRAVLLQGKGGCLGDPRHGERVVDGAGAGSLPGDDLGERGELGDERVGQPVHEERPGLSGRPAGAGLEVAERGVVGPAGGDTVGGAVQLEPDVVPARVVAGVGHDRGGAVVEGEQGLRGGDVAELGEEVVTAGAAGGVDLDDLAAGDPPHRVEVVDRAVAEDPARDGDVAARRWCRVQGGRPHGVHPAELTVDHGVAGRQVGRVEPAGVADLDRHPAGVDVVGDGDRLPRRPRRAASRRTPGCRRRRRP